MQLETYHESKPRMTHHPRLIDLVAPIDGSTEFSARYHEERTRQERILAGLDPETGHPVDSARSEELAKVRAIEALTLLVASHGRDQVQRWLRNIADIQGSK